jgi:polyphosphate:AMP phosphotransferase
MFETVSKAQTLDPAAFDAAADERRIRLVALQQRLRAEPCPVIVQFAGIKGAGRLQVANTFTHWMDPRWVRVHAFRDPTDEERERPPYYRYWQALAPSGTIGLYFHAWWDAALQKRVTGVLSDESYESALARIDRFESALAADGAFFFKVWFHLSKDLQLERLEAIEHDPMENWRVDARDWRKVDEYDNYIAAAEIGLRATSTETATWHLIEGSDRWHRTATCVDLFTDELEAHLKARAKSSKAAKKKSFAAAPPKLKKGETSVLSQLDMSVAADKDLFDDTMKVQEARLAILQAEARAAGIPSVLVFEGWDTAGKGGNIRHLTHGLDLRDYKVVPIAAPTDEERAHHYLWRFWRRLGRAGTITVFDRSWYGRVLVEWIEGFIGSDALHRSYGEINEFETQLTDHGAVVLKFWLHVTPEEQLKRFKKRAKIAYKQWKLTDEDWRNREKWDLYEAAVHTMVERTSTSQAPWHLIPANSKRYARLRVVDLFIEALEKRLEHDRRGSRRGGSKSDRATR